MKNEADYIKVPFRLITTGINANGVKINLSGVTLPKEVPVTVDFEGKNIIAVGEAYLYGDDILFSAEIPAFFKGCFACPGFSVSVAHSEGDKLIVVDQCELREVSICPVHADKSIPPLE